MGKPKQATEPNQTGRAQNSHQGRSDSSKAKHRIFEKNRRDKKNSFNNTVIERSNLQQELITYYKELVKAYADEDQHTATQMQNNIRTTEKKIAAINLTITALKAGNVKFENEIFELPKHSPKVKLPMTETNSVSSAASSNTDHSTDDAYKLKCNIFKKCFEICKKLHPYFMHHENESVRAIVADSDLNKQFTEDEAINKKLITSPHQLQDIDQALEDIRVSKDWYLENLAKLDAKLSKSPLLKKLKSDLTDLENQLSQIQQEQAANTLTGMSSLAFNVAALWAPTPAAASAAAASSLPAQASSSKVSSM